MSGRESKTGILVEELKSHELYGILIKASGESRPLPDEKILEDLYAAEDFYERDLQMRLSPTRVFSDVRGRNLFQDQSMHVDDFDELVDIEEPAYDYEPNAWKGDRWAEFRLSFRPVREINRLVLTAPGAIKVHDVPLNWIALDKRYGILQIRPAEGPAVLLTFTGSLLGLYAAGRALPQSIYVDYVTGYTPALLAAHHRDLLRGIRLKALLSTMQSVAGLAAPAGGAQSNSLSLDGLSRSKSFGGKWGPYSGAIEMALSEEAALRQGWKDKERGVPIAFLTV